MARYAIGTIVRYAIEFDDEDDEPSLVERDDVSVNGRIEMGPDGAWRYYDCRPPEWMFRALDKAHMLWRNK